MKRILLSLICLLFANSVYAFDSSDAYNTITFSYRDNTYVSQQFVLSTTQQNTATSFKLTVDAKDGGGRPTHNLDGTCAAYCTQNDTARIEIIAYNSSGGVISTKGVDQALKTWGSASNPGWSVAPGDNQHPWTQMNVSVTAADVGGSFANVARIEVRLVNKNEGSYWAGNYGVQFRTPTLQADGTGSNLLYNSEFGVDSNGVKVQGWTPSYSSYSNCGTTSGNAICATQEQNVTANMWGGGEDPNGGTISGQPGGYSSVLTAENADTAAEGGDIGGGGAAAPPAPTPIFVSGITQQQDNRRNSALTGIQGHDLTLNITGDSNLVNIAQIGDGHYLTAMINGGNNSVDITQSSTIIGVNHYLETNIIGNSNNLNILQDGDSEKTAFVTVNGDNNTADVDQIGLGQHYLDLSITGDNHTATVMQQGSGNHSATVNLDGSQPWTFNLDQNSSVDQVYSLPHSMSDGSIVSGTCAAIGGCNLTVTQQ